jgi:hypothetical protein
MTCKHLSFLWLQLSFLFGFFDVFISSSTCSVKVFSENVNNPVHVEYLGGSNGTTSVSSTAFRSITDLTTDLMLNYVS